jgi:hypothetical protein
VVWDRVAIDASHRASLVPGVSLLTQSIAGTASQCLAVLALSGVVGAIGCRR